MQTDPSFRLQFLQSSMILHVALTFLIWRIKDVKINFISAFISNRFNSYNTVNLRDSVKQVDLAM